jgi:hypothetical protein
LKRTLALMLFVMVIGCRLPEEREGLKPLPEKGTILPYQDMHNRVKVQARAAQDAFYVDNWQELEQMAQVLDQTARLLPNSSDQPNNVKKILAKEADSLKQQAVRLGEAAKAKNAQAANETLREIHLTIRNLRPTE